MVSLWWLHPQILHISTDSDFRILMCYFFLLSFLQVAERFIAAIDESTKPPLQMGFFIHYSADDILKQATESTLRYQRGSTSQQLKYQIQNKKTLFNLWMIPSDTVVVIVYIHSQIVCKTLQIQNKKTLFNL